MRAFFQDKRLILFLAVLALGALSILAISLNQMPFREGINFASSQAATAPIPPDPINQPGRVVPLWKEILVWFLAGLMFVLVSLLLSPEMRKRLLRLLFRLAFTAWAIYFLFKKG